MAYLCAVASPHVTAVHYGGATAHIYTILFNFNKYVYADARHNSRYNGWFNFGKLKTTRVGGLLVVIPCGWGIGPPSDLREQRGV